MPGLSSREPISGAFGVGKVHLKFKPKKVRSFPWGIIVFVFAALFAFFNWAWSKPYIRNNYIVPSVRHLLNTIDSFRAPTIVGTIYLNGISQEVNISRNENGTTVITATSIVDAVFAQGFVHASDRLFQMEMIRRASLGQVAEMFGSDHIAIDRTSRTLNIHGLGEQDLLDLNKNELEMLNAYSSGINTYLERTNPLPLAFLFMYKNHSHISPWKPEDTLSMLRLLAFVSSHGGEEELTKSYLSHLSGSDIANEVLQRYPKNTHADIQEAKYYSRNFAPSVGSAAWVILGSMSSSGSAMLTASINAEANSVTALYDLIIDVPGFKVSGASIPGIPLIIQGRNEHVAWAMTVAPFDTEDIFMEQIRTVDDKSRFLLCKNNNTNIPFKTDSSSIFPFAASSSTSRQDDTYEDSNGNIWKETVVRHEVIFVNDQEPFEENVIETTRGPVISHLLQGNGASVASLLSSTYPGSKTALSLASQALRKEFGGMKSLWLLNTALSVDDVKLAAESITGVAMNIVYATTTGEAGYVVTGRVPVRSDGHIGDLPVDPTAWPSSTTAPYFSSWTGEHSSAVLPHSHLSSSSTPEGKDVAGGSNEGNGDVVMSVSFRSKERLQSLLLPLSSKDKKNKNRKMDIDDLKVIHCDDFSQRAVHLQKIILRQPLASDSADNALREVKDILQNFNGSYSQDASEPLLLEAMRFIVTNKLRRIFGMLAVFTRESHLAFQREPVYG
eukprot:gene2657-5213_t